MTTGHKRSRGEIKRELILEAALRHFAERGYANTRIEDVAVELEIAKGSVFQHFRSKAGLFLAAYREAVTSFPKWLDAPADVIDLGFFEVMRYWLLRTEHLIQKDWVPYRVALIGSYNTDLALKREINRFLLSEDPSGTLEFIEFGIGREEIRKDVDPEMLASMVDWLADRFQDALVTDELDPGLFHRRASSPTISNQRIEEFMRVIRDGMGT